MSTITLDTSHDEILVEVLEGGKLPTKANSNDAGFDVYATEDIVLYPGQVKKHPLNIKLSLPPGAWARIETKSGLGAKGMMVWAGVIDEGYRGIPHVIMSNIKMTHGVEILSQIIGTNQILEEDLDVSILANREPIVIKKGEKVAQITMNPHSNSFHMVQVDRVDANTKRGEGGFGSSGRCLYLLCRYGFQIVSQHML